MNPFFIVFTSCLLFEDASIVVDENESPTVTILSPLSTDVLYARTDVLLHVQVEDDQDLVTDLKVDWMSDVDGVLYADWTPNAQGESLGRVQLSSGTHVLTVSVVDVDGGIGQQTVEITVQQGNDAPNCSLESPEDETLVALGQEVGFRGVATDSNMPNQDLTVEWQSSVSGLLGTSSPTDVGDVFYALTFDTVETHWVTMLVTDDVGATCSDEVLIEVVHGPQVKIVQPEPETVVVSGSNTIFEGAIQHDGVDVNTVSVQWSSSLEGELASGSPASDGTVMWVGNFQEYGLHEIALTAEDEQGMVSSDSIEVVYNAMPVIQTINMNPANPTKEDVVTCRPTYSDEDGGALDVEYAWSNRRGDQYNSSTEDESSATLDLSELAIDAGTSVVCSVTVTDEYGYAATQSLSVMVSHW